MNMGRPVSWGIAVGLAICVLGLVSYFGVLLYERIRDGYDWANMSVGQWALDAAIWLFCLGTLLVLMGVLWLLIGGHGGGAPESTGAFTPSELEMITKQTERARRQRGSEDTEAADD